jgi:quercetin dioxygenase-like cupin family protein
MKRKESSVDLPFGRRDLFSATAVVGVVAAAASVCKAAVGAADAITPAGAGIRAFKLYTGRDNASHVLEGTIDEKARTDVIAIHFKETPAHSSYDWHPDPEPQYVITLSGTLEFTTRDGETFVLRPGDVLLAEDNVGTGHKWRLIDNQPWRRAYIVLKPGAKDSFVPKSGVKSGGEGELS